MDTRRPHEIIRGTPAEIRAKATANSSPRSAPRRYLPLTEAEAEMLAGMNEDQRAAWFKKLPMVEKLRRIEKGETLGDA